MRIFLAIAALFHLAEAFAAPPTSPFPTYEVRVLRSDGFGGLRTPDGQQAWVDFGAVSNLGGEPRTGRKFLLPNGDAAFVTTVDLLVTEAPGSFLPASVRPGVTPSPHAIRSPALSHRARPIELHAHIQGPVPHGVAVEVVRAGTKDWVNDPVQTFSAGSVVVASSVIPGETVRVDVAIIVASSASGPANASVTFEAR